MPEAVISNTSPLFYLHQIGHVALALEIPNSLSILDDRLAREIAHLHNLRITGTAGILLKAKQKGFLTEIAPLLQKLSVAGFRLSDPVKANILKLAGE